MINKKGQLKIQQMTFMLIAITIFFVLAGLFILAFKLAGLKDSATESAQQNAQLLVSKLANSPEFSCGDVFDYADVSCVDGDKIMALKQNQRIYDDFWGVSNIEIIKITSENINKECTTSNYPDCGVIRVKEGDMEGSYSSTFIILCMKDVFEGEGYDKCEIARLMVSYEPVD